LSSALLRAVSLLLLAYASPSLNAQSSEAGPDPATRHDLPQVPRVPGLVTALRGLNAGLTFAGVHDSSLGWYEVATPAVGYALSSHYSADATISIYPYRLALNSDATASDTQRLIQTRGDLGDTLLGAHAGFSGHGFRNTSTVSLTAPTGNRPDGLGTGRVTFDLSDHLERYLRQTGLIVDIGGGDSSSLFNRLVTTDYSSLGPIAHFQAGTVVWLARGIYLQSLAYEQLPLGDQKIYTTYSRPGFPSRTVVTGRTVNEDNGFTTSVGIPLTDRITLLTYYNRSLRLHLDTVSTGLTYVWRGTPRRHEMSLIDKAIREAERGTQ
jgi:hypothetical protein